MIYFFYGEDSYTIARDLEKLKQEFLFQNSVSGIEELEISRDMTDQDIKHRLQELFETRGLFAKNKFVVIKNLINGIGKLPKSEQYFFSNLPALDQQVSVAVIETHPDKRLKAFKQLQKFSKFQEYLIPNSAGLASLVTSRLGTDGYSIEKLALDKLIENLGEKIDLWGLDQVLSKLMLYKIEIRQINLEDIELLIPETTPQNVFDLTNLVAEGHTREAIQFLEKMISHANSTDLKSFVIQIIGALASQLQSLMLVKHLENQAVQEIVSVLGWKEGRVWINQKLARKFSVEKLKSIIADLRALDMRLKTSEEPPRLLLTLFLQRSKV